jgi:hypothetical protein
VMEQWCNSDAFDLGSFVSFSRICNVIDHILSFCDAFEVWLCICCLHKTYCQKQWSNSDGTVMPQLWCDSNTTVMPLIRALFSAFYLGSSMSLSSFWDVIDHISSFCNALGVCLVTQDLLTKTIIKQLWDSDQTVMTQWSNSDAFDLSNFVSYFILLQCLGGVISDTRPFDKNSDQTVMRQWRDSDVTVMEQWWYSDSNFLIL